MYDIRIINYFEVLWIGLLSVSSRSLRDLAVTVAVEDDKFMLICLNYV